MKNIHVLPTDKPSGLGYIFETKRYHIFTNGENPNDIEDNLAMPRNIYITNNEEIKEGDWYLNGNGVRQCKSNFAGTTPMEIGNPLLQFNFKVVLTTDLDLIKDGVQAIDDEFLEWFCLKKGKVDFVEVISIEDDKN